LLVMLHGYSASGQLEEDSLFHLTSASDAHGFLYALPDGTVDNAGKRFWNATDACCNFYRSTVDDVAYLNAVIDDIASKYNVDPKQVFAGGHSNGAMMAQVLACRSAARIAAVFSYAGALWANTSMCAPDGAVSMVELHGDADSTVPYEGGSNAAYPQSPPYPRAAVTVTTWASRDGCTGALLDDGKTLDLVPSLPGGETTIAKAGGCPPGIGAELWTIHGGAHMDALSAPTFGDAVWGFLHGHPKP
jgi:polyhydroxybutyrate depolymerase